MKVNIVLPKAHPAQQKVIDSKARYRIVMAGRRFGKSVIVQRECIERMLKGQYCAYVTPKFKYAKGFFNYIRDTIPDILIKSANRSDLTIELITGGSIQFFTGKELDDFRSRKFHLVAIDEVSYIPNLEEYYHASIKPTLIDFKGSVIMISTPRGMDFFNKMYERGVNGKKGYESFHFTSYDNPYLPVSAIEEEREELPDMIFKQEYLAIPCSDADNPFGPDIDNYIIEELSDKEPVVFGIDLAKYKDYTVVIGLDEDGCMCYFDRFQMNWIPTIERLKQLPEFVDKIVDSTGVGDVIYEQLQDSMSNVIGFKFTGVSKPQLIYQLIKDVQSGNVYYNEITAKEMKSYEYKRNPTTGNISFNAKSGYHDDTIAALALANKFRKEYISNSNFEIYAI